MVSSSVVERQAVRLCHRQYVTLLQECESLGQPIALSNAADLLAKQLSGARTRPFFATSQLGYSQVAFDYQSRCDDYPIMNQEPANQVNSAIEDEGRPCDENLGWSFEIAVLVADELLGSGLISAEELRKAQLIVTRIIFDRLTCDRRLAGLNPDH